MGTIQGQQGKGEVHTWQQDNECSIRLGPLISPPPLADSPPLSLPPLSPSSPRRFPFPPPPSLLPPSLPSFPLPLLPSPPRFSSLSSRSVVWPGDQPWLARNTGEEGRGRKRGKHCSHTLAPNRAPFILSLSLSLPHPAVTCHNSTPQNATWQREERGGRKKRDGMREVREGGRK